MNNRVLTVGSAAMWTLSAQARLAPATTPADAFTVSAPQVARPVVARVTGDVRAGVKRVERFFRQGFARPFTVEVLPERRSFDERLKRELGGEEPQRWMVALGVSRGVVLLSPDRWKSDAVEHDGSDARHVREIITHELVHVFHAQQSPSRDFERMDELGWLVEGLAVYVSGQLSGPHGDEAVSAIREGKAPGTLAGAWSGRYRYGVSGSLARFVDRRFGRRTLLHLLKAVSQRQVLETLNRTEAQLLGEWKSSVGKEHRVPRAPWAGYDEW